MTEMNKSQTDHMLAIIEWVTDSIKEKYPLGAEEHDSELDKDYDILEVNKMLGEEITDLVTYFVTQQSRIVELVNRVKELEAQLHAR